MTVRSKPTTPEYRTGYDRIDWHSENHSNEDPPSIPVTVQMGSNPPVTVEAFRGPDGNYSFVMPEEFNEYAGIRVSFDSAEAVVPSMYGRVEIP